MMIMDQDAVEGLTLYYCCQKCQGLLSITSLSDAVSHVSSCKSDIYRSSCDMFAVDRQTCLTLCADDKCGEGRPEIRTAPCQIEDGESSNDTTSNCHGDTKVESEAKNTVDMTLGESGKVNNHIQEDEMPSQELCTRNDKSPSTGSDLELCASVLEELCHGHKLEASEKTSNRAVSGRVCTKTWLERREALERKYSKYVISSKATSGRSSKRKYAKVDKHYQCPHCVWKTTHVGHFHRHLQQRHDNGMLFQCSQCQFSCVDSKEFRRHKNQHEKPFVCEECNMRFTFKKDLQRHVWKHSGLKPFECEHCDFKTRFKETMTSHLRKHTGEKLKCNEDGCEFETIHPSSLRLHKSVKHPRVDSKVYQCVQCPYNTLNHATLTEHMKRHANEKNFYCSLCDYRGISKAEVIKHMNIHTKDRQYFCDKCSYVTIHRTAFVNHMRTHSGLKPFQCSACGYSSITKQKVVRHISGRKTCRHADIYQHKDDFHVDLAKYQRKQTPNSFQVHSVSTGSPNPDGTETGGTAVGRAVLENSRSRDEVDRCTVVGQVDRCTVVGQVDRCTVVGEVDRCTVVGEPVPDGPGDRCAVIQESVVGDVSFGDGAVHVMLVDDAASYCTVVTDTVLTDTIEHCVLGAGTP